MALRLPSLIVARGAFSGADNDCLARLTTRVAERLPVIHRKTISERLLGFAAHPGDSEDTASRNALVLGTASACCAAGLVWSAMST